MNANTRVTMHHDGTAYVDEGNSARLWSKREVDDAPRVSRRCCELRRVRWPIGAEHCPCLACCITVAKNAYTGLDARIDEAERSVSELEMTNNELVRRRGF